MSVLSEKNRDLLSRFDCDYAIEICTHPGRALGEILKNDSDFPESVKSGVNTLLAGGYLTWSDVFRLGLRYARVVISERGKKLIDDERQ